MKSIRNNTIVLLIALTLANLLIFYYKDNFIYHQYGDYSCLYSSETGRWSAFVKDYPHGELVQAKKIIDSAIPSGNLSSVSTILGIGKLLYTRFHNRNGVPSATLARASPLQQYNLLNSSDSEKLWCGNFASMFAFFCWSQGIPCRIIEIMNPGDHHVVNECYLKETNNWVMTDVTTNHLLIWNAKRNSYENLLRLRDSLDGPLTSWQDISDSLEVKPFNANVYAPYFGNKNPVNYYYRVNNFEVYKFPEKLKRYLLPIAWYREINSSPKSNVPFYIKQLFILLWLICLVTLVLQMIKFRKHP